MQRYRYLFEQMVRRELRRKYKGSALGVLWYVVNPLVLMGAYTLMFGVLFKFAEIDDYPLFLMVGLVIWIFFSQSLISSAASLIEHASLVGKVRFPRETIPASVVAVNLVTFGAVLALFVPVIVLVRGTVGVELLMLVPLVAALALFVLGCCLAVSVLHAYYRDVAPILSAALLPWFFLSPIFFRIDTIPGVEDREWAEILLGWVNPVAPFIDALRDVLYDGVFPGLGTLAYIAAAAGVALLAGHLVFRRLEPELAVVL